MNLVRSAGIGEVLVTIRMKWSVVCAEAIVRFYNHCYHEGHGLAGLCRLQHHSEVLPKIPLSKI